MTDYEVRLIKVYGDLIRDEALGIAAQKAVREYGKDAPLVNLHIRAILQEIREDYLPHRR